MSPEITFRPFTDQDLALFISWLSMPHVSPWYSPSEDWINELTERKTTYDWITHFIVACDGKPIGFCQYYPYDKGGETWHGNLDITDTYSIDYMIGDPNYLKKGLGKAIATKLTKIIFSDTDAKVIIVQPEAENAASRHTLSSSGYTYDKTNDLYLITKK